MESVPKYEKLGLKISYWTLYNSVNVPLGATDSFYLLLLQDKILLLRLPTFKLNFTVLHNF